MAKACWSYIRKPHPPPGWPAGGRVPKIAALERYRGSYVYLRTWDAKIRGYAFENLGFKVRQADGSLDPDRKDDAIRAVLDASRDFREGRSPGAVTRASATLGAILNRYLKERTTQKGTPDGRSRDHQIADLFLRVFGGDQHPKDIMNEWTLLTRIVEPRHRGHIGPRGEPVRVEDRVTVGYSTCRLDLRTFAAMMQWARKVNGPDGRTLLAAEDFPPEPPWTTALHGVFRRKGQRTPDRPMYSRGEIRDLIASAPSVHPLMQPLIVLSVETGRRISAILNLQRGDVDLEPREYENSIVLTFRAEHDKTGNTSQVPLTKAAEQVVRGRLAAILEDPSAWLFPSPRTGRGPMTYSWAVLELAEVEDEAGVERKHGRAFHAFRRAFATERLGRGDPAPLVEFFGGWSRGSTTLKKVYTQVDRRPELIERYNRSVDEVRI